MRRDVFGVLEQLVEADRARLFDGGGGRLEELVAQAREGGDGRLELLFECLGFSAQRLETAVVCLMACDWTGQSWLG